MVKRIILFCPTGNAKEKNNIAQYEVPVAD